MRRRTTVASLTCALLAAALGLAACAEPGRPDAEAPIVIAEIVDKHPEETVAILRQWMYQQD